MATQGFAARLEKHFGDQLTVSGQADTVLTAEVAPENLLEVARTLRDHADFAFEQLTDLCGVDYLGYGQSEWETRQATSEGFSRGVEGLGPGRFTVEHTREQHRFVEKVADGFKVFAETAIRKVLATAVTDSFDREYAERRNPEFFEDADPRIDAFNVANLVRYAFILRNLGENKRSDALLDTALAVVRTQPRIGLAGHGIRDVQILAIQGKTIAALAALRDAIDEGFRGTVASNGWPMLIDPYLESLRAEPEFQAMVGELDDAIARMQQRVAEAEQSGNWDALRALIERS